MATLLFDGDCGFCSACARFIDRRIPSPAVVVPWQVVDVRRFGLTEAECAEAIQWINDPPGPDGPDRDPGRILVGGPILAGGAILAGPAAAAALLRGSRGGWRVLGRLLGTRPALALGWPVYRWIARHRHQLPGGTAACAIRGPAEVTQGDARHAQ